MAQRCSHCGRTEKKHLGPDGKYLACFVPPNIPRTNQPINDPSLHELYDVWKVK